MHGYPALLDHDPANHALEVTWREPGGIELTVHAKQDLGRRQLLATAEGSPTALTRADPSSGAAGSRSSSAHPD